MPKIKKKHDPIRSLAEAIANDLFTDGSGREAARLVMDYRGDKGGTGWCKSAAMDRILDVLKAELPSI